MQLAQAVYGAYALMLIAAIGTVFTIVERLSYERSDDAEVMRRLEVLQADVDHMTTEFCETINQMHRIRGFRVLDCKTGRVDVEPVE